MEQIVFDLDNAVLGPQNLLFIFLEGRGNVAFGVGQGLLSLVVLGHPGDVTFGHFDVVTKDLVEPHLKGRNPCALPFLQFQAGDPALPFTADGAKLIQFGVELVPDQSALPQHERRIVDNRPTDCFDHVFEQIDSLAQFAEQRALQGGEEPDNSRQSFQRCPQGHQILGIGRGHGNLGIKPFKIVNTVKQMAQILAHQALTDHLGHRLVSAANPAAIDQGGVDPLAQLASAHGGDGSIENAEQRSALAAVLQGGGQFQVAASGLVQNHVVPGMVGGQFLDMTDRPFLGLPQIVKHGPGRPHRPGQLGAAEGFKGRTIEKIFQQTRGPIRLKDPFRYRVDHPTGELAAQEALDFPAVSILGQQHLAGIDSSDFTAEPLPVAGFGHPELAGGDVEHGNSPSVSGTRGQGHQVIVLLGLQRIGIDHQAGGYNPNNLPLDDPFGGPGVFNLLADGNLESVFDQLGNVGLAAVIRDSAQRDFLA